MPALSIVTADPAALLIDKNIRTSAPDKTLIDSVRTHGILVPIVCINDHGQLRVRDGHRRTLAAMEAGITDVPIVVTTADDTDTDRIVAQYAINQHRVGLTPSDPGPANGGPLVPAPGSSESAPLAPGAQPKLGPGVGLNQDCKNLGNNRLCVMNDPQGYRMWYHKVEGDPVHLSFRLQKAGQQGMWTDQGFEAHKGHEYSYVFKVGNQGECYGWLYNMNPHSTDKWRVGPVHF